MVLAVAALLCVSLVPSVAGAESDGPLLFVRPQTPNGIAYDPWLGGAWIAAEGGLFFAEAGSGRVVHYGVQDGLPSGTVYDVAPAPSEVWIGTPAGPAVLSKSQGVVQRVTMPGGDRLSSATRTVYVDGATVWVGTNDAGLFRVDVPSRVARVVDDPRTGEPFAEPILGLDAIGEVLLVSQDGRGLLRWDRGTGRAETLDHHLLAGSPRYGRVLATAQGIWVGTTGDGALLFEQGDDNVREFAGPATLNSHTVLGLAQAGSETWFAVLGGVSRYDATTDTWTQWSGSDFAPGHANDVALVDGQVHAVTKFGAVMRFDRATGTWVDAGWWPDDRRIPNNVVIDCAIQGQELLFGTGGGGAAYFDPDLGSWRSYVATGFPEGDTIPNIHVAAVAVDERETWFGTSQGIGVLDRSDGDWAYFRTDGNPVGHASRDPVNDLALTPDAAWVATLSTQLYGSQGTKWRDGNVARIDRGTGAITTWNTTDGISNGNVTQVAVGHGRVWIGTNQAGLDVLDPATGDVVHVYPANRTLDGVGDILVRDDAVWVGTILGLVRVDPIDLDHELVPGFGRRVITSLVEHDGVIWGGTRADGIFRFDPATGESAFFENRAWVHCLLPTNDLMYVGTAAGLDRFELASQRFLPKYGPHVPASSAPAATVTITAPVDGASVDAGSALDVAGTAEGPMGAAVEVRVGTGVWTTADQGSEWRAVLDTTSLKPGPATVTARLRVDEQTLAQTAITVVVEASDPGPPDVQVRHVPVLQVVAGDRATFEVSLDPAVDGASGRVILQGPADAHPTDVPLAPVGVGTLRAEVPMDTPGEWTYVVDVSWPGGGALLPEPGSGFGDAYRTTVVEPSGTAEPIAILEPTAITASPGDSIRARLTVQNAGTRDATVRLTTSGPAAAWVSGLDTEVSLGAVSSITRDVQVDVPPDAAAGTVVVNVTAVAVDVPGDAYSASLTIVVDERGGPADGPQGGANGTPGVGAPLLLAVLALAGAVRRRQGLCPR